MANDNLKFTASLDDQFTANAKRMASGATDLGKAAMAAGKAFLAFEAVKTAGAFLNTAYNEAKQAEIATAKLTAALGKQSKALADQANALQYKSRFEDDEITSMQAKLAGHVKSEEAIRQLTPAILDMAEATGTDLQTAATQVARAIADDNEELGRYKIKVEGAAGSSERATSIIKGLNEKFKGNAESAAVAAGEVELLQKAFLNMAEEVGKKLKPAVDGTAKTIREMFFFGNMSPAEQLKTVVRDADVAIKDYQKLVKSGNTQFQVNLDQAVARKEAAMKKYYALDGGGKSAAITDMVADPSANKEAQKKAQDDAAKAYADKQKAAEDHAILMAQIRQSAIDDQLAAEKEANDKATKEGDAFRERQLALKKSFYEQDAAAKIKAEEAAKKAAAERIQTDWAVAQNAIGTTSLVIDALEQGAIAAGANAKEMQAIRIGEVWMDAAASSVAMWRGAFSTLPYPAALVMGGISQAAIIALAAASTAQISQQKFADGGIVRGPSSGDRVQVRANGGEMVLNEQEQANLFAMATGSRRNGGMGNGGTVINAGITINGTFGGSAADIRRAQAEQEKMISKTLRRLGNTGKVSQSVFA